MKWPLPMLLATVVTAAPAADLDREGIPDALERTLALKYAPEVRIRPQDWTLPSNVDIYLPEVSLRFDHGVCPDHEVLALGSVTPESLSAQTHATDVFPCRHGDHRRGSNEGTTAFYLTPAHAQAVYEGSADPSQWRVYVHVFKSPGVGTVSVIQDRTAEGGPRWRTEQDLVNLGERRVPLGGQLFGLFGGRLGKPGWVSFRAGPVGPTFHASYLGDLPSGLPWGLPRHRSPDARPPPTMRMQGLQQD